MATLVVDRLFKNYGGVVAVNGISFEVGTGEFVSLLGPSGCGKTTTLRCIAGFEHPNGGRILLDGKPIVDAGAGVFTPPNKRHFGMVFQSYAIWPHMKVAENVAYPLKVQGRYSASDMRDQVAEKLKVVGLAGYEERYPPQLSGGQQQRVALARALVMEPRALLFDEPLSNLDAKLRERMRFELLDIQSRLGIPAVYVTHDQSEAMVMSQRVIVMERGVIAQAGSPDEIYAKPRSRFVADFIGLSNFIEAEILAPLGDGAWRVQCGFGALDCMSDQLLVPGQKVLVIVRPEAVQIEAAQISGGNSFAATLKQRYFLGPYCEYFLHAGDIKLRAQNSRRLPVNAGEPIYMNLPRESCRILDEVTDGTKRGVE
jgi:iron(III) transport system ATP-binding protein